MPNKDFSSFSGVFLAATLMAGLAGCSSSATPTPKQQTMEASESKGDPVAVSDLPQAVVDGVQKEMPGAMLVKARKQSDGNYRLSDVKVGRQEYNLIISPKGKVLQKEEDND